MQGVMVCVLLQAAFAQNAKELTVLTGKSLMVDSPVNIQRVALADGGIAEVLTTSPRELLIHGKTPGQTSLIVWQQGGNRLLFDLNVLPNNSKTQDLMDQLKASLSTGKRKAS